jgi:hypothetical protein
MTAKDKKGKTVELPDFISKKLKMNGSGGDVLEVIHIKTRVKYICLSLNSDNNALTPMLNSDGTLLLATNEEIIELLRERWIYVE